MKTNTAYCLFCLKAFFPLFLLFSTSCDKEKVDPQKEEGKPSCLLVREERDSYSYNTAVDMVYNTQGLIVSNTLTHHDGTKQVTTYERNSANKVSKIVSSRGSQIVRHTVFEYDSQERWARTAESDNSVVLEAEYDNQNRIAKIRKTVMAGSSTYNILNYTYEYANGNLVKIAMNQGGLIEVTELEYYTDKLDIENDYDNVNRIRWTELSGSASKNLVKKMTTTRPSHPSHDFSLIRDFTYKINEKGYPALISSIIKRSDRGYHTEDTSIVTRSYQCK